jgi:hypothetical protein
MRQFIFGAAAIAAAMFAMLATTPVRAEVEYPWCGYARLGAGSCGFATLEQCQAFITGTGGRCERNARYAQGSTVPSSRARR